MARLIDRGKAIDLRLQGKSYSEIKSLLGISKSTLHYWLRDYPLSEERMKELCEVNPRRIENFRSTMRRKREERLALKYTQARKDIKFITDRELFISGIFLFWAEGTKALKGSVTLTNSNPTILRVFIKWLESLGAERKNLKVLLQLYADMDIKRQTSFWSKELKMPVSQFRNPYIKKSNQTSLTYKGGVGQGTCTVIYYNQEIANYVAGCLKYIMEIYQEK